MVPSHSHMPPVPIVSRNKPASAAQFPGQHACAFSASVSRIALR